MIQQLTLVGRNGSNGAIYAIWYDITVNAFRVAAVISGPEPTNGQTIRIQYIGEPRTQS